MARVVSALSGSRSSILNPWTCLEEAALLTCALAKSKRTQASVDREDRLEPAAFAFPPFSPQDGANTVHAITLQPFGVSHT